MNVSVLSRRLGLLSVCVDTECVLRLSVVCVGFAIFSPTGHREFRGNISHALTSDQSMTILFREFGNTRRRSVEEIAPFTSNRISSSGVKS